MGTLGIAAARLCWACRLHLLRVVDPAGFQHDVPGDFSTFDTITGALTIEQVGTGLRDGYGAFGAPAFAGAPGTGGAVLGAALSNSATIALLSI